MPLPIAVEGSFETLADFARRLLGEAQDMAQRGFAEHDAIRVRKAAERAWKAACAATDAAMAARGVPRDGTAADRARHYAFLDSIDGGSLAFAYASFADRLHALCAHEGHLPTVESWDRQMAALQAFVEELTAPRAP